MQTLQIGAYKCEISFHLGKWLATDFRMCDVHGLNVEGRFYQHKRSALRYAKKILNAKASSAMQAASLK